VYLYKTVQGVKISFEYASTSKLCLFSCTFIIVKELIQSNFAQFSPIMPTFCLLL